MACVRLKQETVCHGHGHGRLGGCIGTSGDDDRRRWRSDLGGDDVAETSAAVRRHSRRVLSRWMARETITATLDDRRRREAELVALAELHTASILQRWRELEEESRAEVRNGRLSRQTSPETNSDVDRERVRQIVGMMDSQERHGSMIRDESPRGEWLGERERERVRVVRERVWMASLGEGRRGERERENGGGNGNGEVPRLRGRQARDDVIMRMSRERQRELQGLSEHRAVSGFAHRNRIHLFLRGRFLRRSVDNERPQSLADRELGLIRQRHSVSGLREGFSFTRDGDSSMQASSELQSNDNTNEPLNIARSSNENFVMEMSSNDHSETNEHNLIASQLLLVNDTTENERNIADASTEQSLISQEENLVEELTNTQERVEEETNINWEIVENGETNLSENIEEWTPNALEDTAESWHNLVSHHTPGRHLVSARRANRFSDTDDDSTYGVEIRELLSRRSVSSLLRSNFRESLDQLIRSYVQRQENTPLDWDLEEEVSPVNSSPEQEQTQARNDSTNELYIDEDLRARVNLPPPPAPPGPLWRSNLHTGGWTRQTVHQPEIDWDIVNVLREEMSQLQEGMGNLQRMVEACMEMQLEVQRSVRQEVSAALNRTFGYTGSEGETTSYGSKWTHVKKGTCCVCCDNHIDSLLYRCGHMCTCNKCANELARGGDKCPLCRAPIVEVIRAYSIL